MDPDSLDPELLPSIFQNYYDSITKIKTLSQTTLQQFLGVYTSMINELKQSEVAAVINPEERKEFYNLVEQYAEKAAPEFLFPTLPQSHVCFTVKMQYNKTKEYICTP